MQRPRLRDYLTDFAMDFLVEGGFEVFPALSTAVVLVAILACLVRLIWAASPGGESGIRTLGI